MVLASESFKLAEALSVILEMGKAERGAASRPLFINRQLHSTACAGGCLMFWCKYLSLVGKLPSLPLASVVSLLFCVYLMKFLHLGKLLWTAGPAFSVALKCLFQNTE